MPWSNITSGLAAERLSLHGDDKAPTNQAHMLPTGLGSTAALRAVMVAATLFASCGADVLGPPANSYRGNSYELASIC